MQGQGLLARLKWWDLPPSPLCTNFLSVSSAPIISSYLQFGKESKILLTRSVGKEHVYNYRIWGFGLTRYVSFRVLDPWMNISNGGSSNLGQLLKFG